jgi:protein TonB
MIPILLVALAASPMTTSGEGAARPPRAKSNLAALIRDGDYPEAAMRADEQGVVSFSLDVAADGRVRACRVTSSSGSKALDEATCTIMIKRARFAPGRDAAGKAAAGTVSSRIGWHMSF